MTINYELRNRPDKQGLCQLRYYTQDKGSRKYFPLELKLLPKDWDQKKQEVRKSHKDAGPLNKMLSALMAEKHAAKYLGDEKTETVLFGKFALQCLSRWEKTKSAGTLKSYGSMLRQVNRFGKPFLHEVTPSWLHQYEAWSRKDGCSHGGTEKRIAFISTIINEALRFELIVKDPFKVYRRPVSINPARVWLTADELESIWNLKTESLLKNIRVWFLLACYTGLRYSDVVDITDKIQEGRLILATTKTGQIVSIKINSKMQSLFDEWPQVPVYTNQKCNQYLKALAHVCDINKPLTFHVARHTFAVQCANKGISMEVTSKLLGHSDLQTTSLYYKIINQRIDKEMEKWD